MKYTASFFPFLIAGASALQPLSEHTDLKPDWQNGVWNWTVQTAISGAFSPGITYFPVRDAAYPTGDRWVRPASSSWSFLGMASGEAVWILPQTDNGAAWPGFLSNQTNPFVAYTETDVRAVGSARWLRFALVSIQGPAGGNFSLYNTNSGTTTIWMRTDNGIAADDAYLMGAGNHAHMNWAFSKRGMWCLKFSVSGRLGAGGTNPTPPSVELPVYFAVGGHADWRARQFTSLEVMEESVAGPLADPDRDGVCNLLEYAFGGHPKQASLLRDSSTTLRLLPAWGVTTVSGSSYPTLSYYRRKSSTLPLISYQVEWQSGLQPESWTTGGTPVSATSIDANWEFVTIRDTQAIAPGSPARFCRVRIVETP